MNEIDWSQFAEKKEEQPEAEKLQAVPRMRPQENSGEIDWSRFGGGEAGGEAMEADVNPFENLFNGAIRGAVFNTISDYQALFQQYDAARRTQAYAQEHFPTAGVAGTVGEMVGGIATMVPAMLAGPPGMLTVLANEGARAMGRTSMEMEEQEEETGEEIGALTRATEMAGHGALSVLMNAWNLGRIGKVVDVMGKEAALQVGLALREKGVKAAVQLAARKALPIITASGGQAAGINALEQVGENALDKFYKDSPLFQDLGAAAGMGGLSGMILAPVGVAKAYHDMAIEGAFRKAQDSTAVPDVEPVTGYVGPEPQQSRKPQPSRTWQELAPGEKKHLQNFYKKYMQEGYEGKKFGDLEEEQRRGVIESWETHTARQEKPKVITPDNEEFRPYPMPDESSGYSTSYPERWAYEESVRDTASRKAPYIGGELYFQKSDGSTDVIPVTGDTVQRQIRRIEASGLVKKVVVHDDMDSFPHPDGGSAHGYFDTEAGEIHLSRNVLPNTVGHEMFEAAWDTLSALNDPVIERALGQWGGKERIADIYGEYFAGSNANPGLMQNFSRWIRSFWGAFKARLGMDISKEEFVSRVESKLRNITIDQSPTGSGERQRINFQPTTDPIPLPGYFGNKRQLAAAGAFDKIIGKFQKIVEPFGGSGFFGNKLGPNSERQLNDLDPNVINFHNQTNTEGGARKVYAEVLKLAKALQKVKDKYPEGGSQARRDVLKLWKDFQESADTAEKQAAVFWYKHSAYTSTNGFITMVLTSGKWHTNPYNIPDQAGKIMENPNYLKKTTITQKEARKVIDEADKDALLLLDPPYPKFHLGRSVQKYSKGRDLQTEEGALSFIYDNVAPAVAEGRKIVYTNYGNPALIKALQDIGMSVTAFPRNQRGAGAKPITEIVAYTENISAFFQGVGLRFQSAEAARQQARFDAQREALRKEGKLTAQKVWRAFKVKFVDSSSNIKNQLQKLGEAGKAAVRYHDLVRGSAPAAVERMRQMEKVIWHGLGQADEEMLADIAVARRNIALYESNPKKYGNATQLAEDSRKWLAELPPEIKNRLMPRVERLFAEYRQVLDQARQEQLITAEAYDKMAAVGPYLPREHLDYIDPIFESIRGIKMSVRDSGFYRMKELAEDDVIQNDMRMLLYETMARLSARSYKNKANRELLKLAQENPENGIIKLPENVKDPIVPKGYTPVGVMVDGKPQLMYMPEEAAKEWIVMEPVMQAKFSRWLGWVTGTTPLKMMATGMNPAFAVANFARDLAHVFLTTDEYSSNMLAAAPQLLSDLGKTMKDAWRKTGAFEQFVKEGGGMGLLTYQGQDRQPGAHGNLQRKFEDIQGLLGKLGEFTEIWTRLALRERALKNGKSAEEATYVARNYLDFSQGGSYAKAIDTVIPYFNASIQGTRGVFRAAKNNPQMFAWKATQLGLLSSSLAAANALVNPETWDALSDEEKNGYFIIARPEMDYKDAEGNVRHSYIRVAKDQGQRGISAVFEELTLGMLGRPMNRDRIARAALDILPIVPDGSILPPLVKALLGYVYNKDFFRNEDVWKGEELSKKSLEYTRQTNPAYLRLTELPLLGENISPERMRYAVNQIFVQGNPFSWLVGNAFRQIGAEAPGIEKERVAQELWMDVPGVNRLVRSTYPGLAYKKEIKQMQAEEASRTTELRREVDDLIQADLTAPSANTKKALRDFMRKLPRTDRARFEDRIVWQKRLFNQPNRQWWLSISQLPPELRAAAFYSRWTDESPEVRQQLSQQSRKIPGISSLRFQRELRRLLRTEPLR